MRIIYSEYTTSTSGKALPDFGNATFNTMIQASTDYNSSLSYSVGATVLNQGALWRCISAAAANQGPPTLPDPRNTYWEYLGSQGTFTWIAYASTPTGTGTGNNFTIGAYDEGGIIRKYIGIANNKNTPTESSTASDYTWSKFIGDDGVSPAAPITVVVSKPSVSVPTDSDGNNGIYTGTGTIITVYEGQTALTYDGTGTGPGKWTIATTTPSNITTPGTASVSSGSASISPAAGLTSDTGSVVYNISGKNSAGTSFSITATQTFSKVKGAVLDTLAPKPPTALTLSSGIEVLPGGNSIAKITATWTAPTQNTDNSTIDDLSYYDVQIKSADSPIGEVNWVESKTSNTRQEWRVAPNTSYIIRVRAVDKNENKSTFDYVDPDSSESFVLSGVTIGAAGTFTCTSTTLAVNQPMYLSGALGTATITGYSNPKLYYIKTTNGTTSFTLSETPGGATVSTTSGTIGSLSVSKRLSYIVVSKDSVPPAVPTSPTAASTFKSIFLEWTNATDQDLAAVNVYESTDGGVTYGTAPIATVPASSISTKGNYTRTGLDSSVTRYYKLTSVDSSQNESSKPLTGVTITGTAGQFSCSAAPFTLTVGSAITISTAGAVGGTGSITGYTNPKTYYIIATNGSTTFTLSATPGGTAVATTAGTPTGLTYTATQYSSVVSATTSQLANVDIGSGAIDALSMFSTGIEPVGLVDTLPTSKVHPVTGAALPNSIYVTTLKKLYRWDSGTSSYTSSVPGADIVANSITAGQIQAGAISATEIASNSITTSKMIMTGSNVIPNSDFATGDFTNWSPYTTATLPYQSVVASSISTTAMAGTSGVVTLTFPVQPYAPFSAGDTIYVTGAVPSAYNGTFTVLASPAPTTTSVSYSHTATGTQTTAATISNFPATALASIPTANVAKYSYDGAALQIGTFSHDKAYSEAGSDKDGFAVDDDEEYSITIHALKDAAYDATNGLRVSAYFYNADGTHTNAQLCSLTPILNTTGASGASGIATINFPSQSVAPYAVGDTIKVAGVTPLGYNGTYVITAATTSSVSFENNTSGSQTVAGTITLLNRGSVVDITGASVTGGIATLTFATQTVAPYLIGDTITVSGAAQSSYNGTYVLSGATTSSISYATSTATGIQSTTKGTIKLETGAYRANTITPSDLSSTVWTQYIGKFSVPSGSIRCWLFVRDLNHTAGNLYWTKLRAIRRNNAQLIVDGSITSSSMNANTISGAVIKAGTLNADKIVAGSLTADLIAVPAAGNFLDPTIQVGSTTGVTIGNPVSIIENNAAATTISPGKIKIGGASTTPTTLNDWITNTTEINGGAISANTITADKISIGSRGVTFAGVQFTASSNTAISWTGGTVSYVDLDSPTNTYVVKNFNILAGSTTRTAGQAASAGYLYWDKASPTVITFTTSSGTATSVGRIIVATWLANSSTVNATYGGTIIDGGNIYANSITANQIKTGSITADRIDSTGLSIKDGSGNIIFAAGTPLSYSNISPTQTGQNIANVEYSQFNQTTIPAMTFSTAGSGFSAAVLDATSPAITGIGALKLTTSSTAGSVAYAYLGINTPSTIYNITLKPSATYLYSAYVKADVVSSTGQLRLRINDSATEKVVSFTTSSTINTWTRVSGVITTNAATTSGLPRLGNITAGTNMWFAGIMIEEVVGSALTSPITLSTVVITGTAGQFSCANANLTLGQTVTLSGTFGGTGSITGYTNPKSYLISATNGTTTFTLVNTDGTAIVTSTGTPTGLTYTVTSTPSPYVAPSINGQITAANASTFIQNAAIGSAQIGSIALVGTSNFSVKTSATSTVSRIEMDSQVIKIFEGSTLRVKIGNLA